MNKLVSIIVPVYNVEKYIKKCITSLINQTYKNCEFIIVNDGTSDNSAEIVKNIDDYRIKVIDQVNAGVSAARNRGIEESTGDYIIFVDADDYLAEDYVEYMMNLIEQEDSDFAYSTENYKKRGEEQTIEITTKHVSSDESIALLLSPKVTVGCWNKIYKRSMLLENNIKFSTDLFYGEGLSFIIKVSQKAKSIVVGNKKVYFYRKNNETSATTKYNNEKFHNGEKSLKLIGDSINLDNDYVKSMYILHLSTFYLGAIVKLIENRKTKNYTEDFKRWKKSLCANSFYIFGSKYISLYRKMMIFGGIMFPHIVAYLDLRKNKKIFVESV